MKLDVEEDYVFNPNQNEILIVLSNIDQQTAFSANIEKIFSFSRIKSKKTRSQISFVQKAPPIIIFESYEDYLSYKKSKEFNEFVRKNKIGLIIFNKNRNIEEVEFTKCQLNDDKFLEKILYTTKFNTQEFKINKKLKYNSEFKKLFYNEGISKSILKCQSPEKEEEILFINIIDKVKHVFINNEIIDDIWLLKPLFIDLIRYLTNGEISIGLKRYIQIDIDDIFVTKLVPEEVDDLIRLQTELSKNYFQNNEHGFKFVIGYSGRLYQNRQDFARNEGDRLILGIV